MRAEFWVGGSWSPACVRVEREGEAARCFFSLSKCTQTASLGEAEYGAVVCGDQCQKVC
jgi:hypothetical protein